MANIRRKVSDFLANIPTKEQKLAGGGTWSAPDIGELVKRGEQTKIGKVNTAIERAMSKKFGKAWDAYKAAGNFIGDVAAFPVTSAAKAGYDIGQTIPAKNMKLGEKAKRIAADAAVPAVMLTAGPIMRGTTKLAGKALLKAPQGLGKAGGLTSKLWKTGAMLKSQEPAYTAGGRILKSGVGSAGFGGALGLAGEGGEAIRENLPSQEALRKAVAGTLKGAAGGFILGAGLQAGSEGTKAIGQKISQLLSSSLKKQPIKEAEKLISEIKPKNYKKPEDFEKEIYMKSFSAYKNTKSFDNLSNNDKRLFTEMWLDEINKYGRKNTLKYALRQIIYDIIANKTQPTWPLQPNEIKAIDNFVDNYYKTIAGKGISQAGSEGGKAIGQKISEMQMQMAQQLKTPPSKEVGIEVMPVEKYHAEARRQGKGIQMFFRNPETGEDVKGKYVASIKGADAKFLADTAKEAKEKALKEMKKDYPKLWEQFTKGKEAGAATYKAGKAIGKKAQNIAEALKRRLK